MLMNRRAVGLVAAAFVLIACRKPAPIVEAAPDAAPTPPRAASPFVPVALFAEGVTANVTSLGDAVAVTQFGPVKWTLSAVGGDHRRVDLIARIQPSMRPLDEQPMFVGGTSIDDLWLSTATGTLHVTPQSTTSRTGHVLALGPLGAGLAALLLDGEDRSLDWLIKPDAGALPKLPPANRLSDAIAFLGAGRVCGRSDGVVWSSGTDGTTQAIKVDAAHPDPRVYRGPEGECMMHQAGEDGTFVGRIRGTAIAWTKIAPSPVSVTSVTRAGALVIALGDELVRVALANDKLASTSIRLPDDAKRVESLVAFDDDDIWFTGPKNGGRAALFHSRPHTGDAPTWPPP